MSHNRVTAAQPLASILVVDDEVAICDLVTRWLTGEGYGCLPAHSLKQAWTQINSVDVQLIISDVLLPDGSGVELLRRAAALPDVPVLMLTAAGDAQTAKKALSNGACGYLIKPVEREELLFQVRQSLRLREAEIERRTYLSMLESRVAAATSSIRRAHEETIHRLVAAATCRDLETGAHITRTGLLSEILALAAGWSRAEAENIRLAAPMHDVGKIGIPDAILLKPHGLTADEFEIMKRHTTIGAALLADSDSPMLQLAHDIAMYHHERWDGTGYSHGLRGEQIPEAARIVAIVDAYDALSHDRVYRPAFPLEQRLEMMRAELGQHFDPGLLGMFFTVLDQIEEVAEQHPDGGQVGPLATLVQLVAGVDA